MCYEGYFKIKYKCFNNINVTLNRTKIMFYSQWEDTEGCIPCISSFHWDCNLSHHCSLSGHRWRMRAAALHTNTFDKMIQMI